jgi:hypothetical protein
MSWKDDKIDLAIVKGSLLSYMLEVEACPSCTERGITQQAFSEASYHLFFGRRARSRLHGPCYTMRHGLSAWI